MSTDSPSRRRWAVSAVLVAALGGAIVAGTGSQAVPSSTRPTPVEPVVMPPTAVSSSAWFCPGGLPGNVGAITDDERDDDTAGPVGDVVHATNTTERDASVRITALRSDGAPIARRFPVAAGSSIDVPVADLTDSPDAAVFVESFADGIVVEEQVGAPGRDDTALAPCATETAATWYFAAGSTVRGSSQWLSLLNPYSSDAVVDITLITNDEVRRPSSLQSLVVGARSRRSLFINDAADRKTIVAVVIEAKEGRRVVAQQTIVHRNVSGRSGVSSTLGAVAPATRFTFASGNRREGNSRLLFVMNPGPVATDVDIQIAASGIPPTTITVEAQSVRTVNLNKLIPVGTRYAVIVQAAADFGGSGGAAAERGIVAEDFEGYRIETAARSVFGVSGGIGVVRPAAEWRFGRSRLTGGGTGQIVLYNPNEAGVTVDVAFVVGDELVRPEAVQGVELAGASSGVIRIDGLVDANAGMIVTATGPVYAERQLVDEETVTRAPGAPVRP